MNVHFEQHGSYSLQVKGNVLIAKLNSAWKHHLRRAAHVYTPSAFKQYYIDKVVVEKQGEFIKHAFSDKESAIKWLASEGYKL